MRTYRYAAIALGIATAPMLAAAQQQPPTSRERAAPTRPADTDEDAQPRTLSKLPAGMTLDLIRQGDSIFHGKGGCVTCHGVDATGMPASGSALTTGVNFIPAEWKAIDSLITAGVPEAITRSPVAMPPRGAQSNLSEAELRAVAAYVWAISKTRDEPWPGGHRTHTAATAPDTAKGERAR